MANFNLLIGGMVLVGILTGSPGYGASLKKNDCLLNAIVKYNECHKGATAFFDVHSGRMITEEEEEDMMTPHTQLCMIEAYKIICISVEAHKCTKKENNQILDSVKQFALLGFHHCSPREIVGLSSRILEYAKENNVTVVTDQDNNDMNRYDVV